MARIFKDKIQNIITKFGKDNNDTGSPEVQIALLTEEILNLNKHLQSNKGDKNSKRGLILKIARRKKLLRYLKVTSYSRYRKVVKELRL
ncbi:MAG: 30S ribosomal protein S15 [Candidatus Parcubacteria bacterium]|nr:MAG: 30S ribosomal protein S15 [Candidatus Parcubacteria bacterium]